MKLKTRKDMEKEYRKNPRKGGEPLIDSLAKTVEGNSVAYNRYTKK